ncbi:hypothetical protein NQ317_007008 [Molorchus minor]|uniref:Conserved oligomeric Golgi complex subunit 2 n=1 Tax=Molorchus minor TaxID=1323400 RepID=A0ABQ9JUT7_9CUCU|nr:hypothetical protein NQ317_007008 [Molorchus minor]
MDIREDLLWKEAFFKENFNVDQCLSKYTQKSDLETLRRELKKYGAELQQQMSEILKTETEAIVNLAEYLTNLNSKIENLSAPICQLQEEIRTLYGLIQSAESSYNIALESLKSNITKRNHIRLKLGIITSSHYIDKLIDSLDSDSFEDMLILERVVNKYSFQKNYMDELGIMSNDTMAITGNVEYKLISMLNKKFLDAFNKGDGDTLTRCLRMYDNLKKQDDAQKTFQLKVVRPALIPLFSERYLEQCDQNIDEIYNEVSSFMNKRMNILSQILTKNPELKSFNFILTSFWKEFDKQSREGLPYITAPGNPELFQKRFKSTYDVVLQIAKKCGNEDLIRKDKTFQEHIKRFNLPVYFEIRYQQIAGNFENDILIENSDIYASNNILSCKLKSTIALWKAQSRSFDEDVYIDQLADQFLKLSMMLLSRYLGCFKVILQEKSIFTDEELETFIMDSLIDLNIVEKLFALETEKLKMWIKQYLK